MIHRLRKPGCCAAVLLGLAFSTLGADDPTSFAMSADAFRRLSPAERKSVVADAFEHRLQHARNLYYESTTRIRNHAYCDGRVGRPLTPPLDGRYTHRRLGDSYRTELRRGGEPGSAAAALLTAGFDAHTRIFKSTVRLGLPRSKDRGAFGRIDVIPELWMADDRYVHWLDGQAGSLSEYVVRSLFEQRDSFRIDAPVADDAVRLIVPWKPDGRPRARGTQEVLLDPRKGFLPVRGKTHWEQTESDGTVSWRDEEFVAEQSRLVGDVWMPTKLSELVRGTALGSESVNVLETDVARIEAGTVRRADLDVRFAAGMTVVDALENATYTVKYDEGPAGSEGPLAGAAAAACVSERRHRARDHTGHELIVTGAGLLVVVGSVKLGHYFTARP